MKVCVQGLWHLGTVTVAGLAAKGHTVLGFDADKTVINNLKEWKPPIFEPRLETTLLEYSDNIRFTSETGDLQDVDFLWVTYDTPVDDNDVADTGFVIDQIGKTLPYLCNNALVLISSQLPIGSIRKLEGHPEVLKKNISFAYSPENLRLGKALDVFLNPDRIIVGVRSDNDKSKINQLLKTITPKIEWMSVESAEMVKHAINSFLAVSVVFSNEIAAICEVTGADAKEVERGLKTEQRIGPKAYLSPGNSFSGGTLARDIEFLKSVSTKHNITTPVIHAVKHSNDLHKSWMQQKIQKLFPDLTGITIAIWGLTYKADTDTLRRSLMVDLCDWLIDSGANVQIHDPVVKELPSNWGGIVKRFEQPLDSLNKAQAVLIGTEWNEYKTIFRNYLSEGKLFIIDPNHFIERNPSFTYISVGSTNLNKRLK